MKQEYKIKVVYDYKHDAKRKGIGTVWVRCYYDRLNRKYVSTDVRVAPNEWDDRYGVIGRRDAAKLNKLIKAQVEECKKKADLASQALITKSSGRRMRVCKSDAPFLDFIQEKMERADLAVGTRKHHKACYDSLSRFGRLRKFEDVNARRIEEWFDFLRKRSTRRLIKGKWSYVPITDVTIADYWKRLRRYIRMAQAEGLIAQNVTAGLIVKRGQSKEREHLTDEEVLRWLETPMPISYLEAARDRFVVQMGTGLAYSDLMSFDFSRCEKVGGKLTLSGRRIKTGKRFFVVILPMAEQVLKRWKWQIPPISLVDYNRYLERVAVLCGINKHITSHVGRHTYACQCLAHGVRIEAVQRTLGHSSIETTQIYARMMDMDVINAFQNYKS